MVRTASLGALFCALAAVTSAECVDKDADLTALVGDDFTCATAVAQDGPGVCGSELILAYCCDTCKSIAELSCVDYDKELVENETNGEEYSCAQAMKDLGMTICAGHPFTPYCCGTCNNPSVCVDKNDDLTQTMGIVYTCAEGLSDYGIGICDLATFKPFCCATCNQCGEFGQLSDEEKGYVCKCNSLELVNNGSCPGKYYNGSDIVKKDEGGGNYVATSHNTYSAVSGDRRRLLDDGTLKEMCAEIVGSMSSAAPDGYSTTTTCAPGDSTSPVDLSGGKPSKKRKTERQSSKSKGGGRRRAEEECKAAGEICEYNSDCCTTESGMEMQCFNFGYAYACADCPSLGSPDDCTHEDMAGKCAWDYDEQVCTDKPCGGVATKCEQTSDCCETESGKQMVCFNYGYEKGCADCASHGIKSDCLDRSMNFQCEWDDLDEVCSERPEYAACDGKDNCCPNEFVCLGGVCIAENGAKVDAIPCGGACKGKKSFMDFKCGQETDPELCKTKKSSPFGSPICVWDAEAAVDCGEFGAPSKEEEGYECKCNSLAEVESNTCPGKYYNAEDVATQGVYVQSVTTPNELDFRRRRMQSECKLETQHSKDMECIEGVSWGCDMDKGELWATKGCRGRFSFAEDTFDCGEGGGEDKIYTCSLPVATLPGKLSQAAKEAIKEALGDSIDKAATSRGLKAIVGEIRETEAVEKYCGFPATKIKVRVEDRTKKFKHVESSCGCELLCRGEDAWLYHMKRQQCQCRGKTEERNRATRNKHWMSSYGMEEEM